MQLSEWEEYLTDHFKYLLKSTAGQRSLLCLEHGLEAEDIALLKQSIRTAVQSCIDIQRYPVTWAVYATEIGYLFSGGEFWITFEKETPGWKKLGAKHALERCFIYFRDHYNGVVPTGPWAQHFHIIGWPITHAILPLDLQRQLAKLLYNLRFRLPDTTDLSAQEFGTFLSTYSWDTTSRFKKLFEQPALIGQISLALLQATHQVDESLILPDTVERIREDLIQVSSARQWMNSTQQYVKNRKTTLKGLHTQSNRGGTTESNSGNTDTASGLVIRPVLQLVPIGTNRWRLRLTIPDYSPLLSKYPQCSIPLTESRVSVVGSSISPIPPKGLLYGPRSTWLSEWPEPGTPLLEFEKSDPTFDMLLQLGCTIDPGIAVFKISSDGTANQLLARMVRTDSRYLLLSESRTQIDIPNTQPAFLDCEGATLYELCTGSNLSTELIAALKKYGISPARQLQLRPAGIPPSRWDGEGAAEWLATEEPIIAIHASYPVNYFKFDLQEEQTILASFTSDHVSPDSPLYLRLPVLTVGAYSLSVSAKPIGLEYVDHGRLDFVIREPVDPIASINYRSAFQVNIYPTPPSLEQLWEGAASLEIIGPNTKCIQCELTLYEQNGHDALFKDTIDTLHLPFSLSDWHKLLRKWQDNKETQYAYEAAGECELVFDGGEMGRHTIVCERQMHPLRWVHKRHSHEYEITLVDDNENVSTCEIHYLSFERPDVMEDIALSTVRQTLRATKSGLYVAVTPTESAGIIVPREITHFDDLRLNPKLQSKQLSIEQRIQIIEYWSGGKLIHIISAASRNRVSKVLIREMFRTLCGNKWCFAERERDLDRNTWIDGMAQAVPSKHFGEHWAYAIVHDLPKIAKANVASRVALLAELIDESPNLVEFAMRLASNPATARGFAGENFDCWISELKYKTTICRIARFFCLVVEDYVDTQSPLGTSLYPSWPWT